MTDAREDKAGRPPCADGPAVRRTSSTAARWLMFAVIALVTCAIYQPAVRHVARADHWSFLADTAGTEGWWPLFSGFYSYNRVRQVGLGDTELFRPVLFLLMCTEVWLFKLNFVWWQVTGIALHLGVVYWLLRIFESLHAGLFAGLCALMFATLQIVQQAVIWHHVSGYLLYVMVVLMAVYHVVRHVEEGQTQRWRACAIAALLLVACHTYEAGVLVCMVVAMHLCIARRHHVPAMLGTPWALLPLVPGAVYALFSGIDFVWIHPAPATETAMVIGSFSLSATVHHAVVLPLMHLLAALTPQVQFIHPYYSVCEVPFAWNPPPLRKQGIVLALPAMIVTWCAISGWLAMRRGAVRSGSETRDRLMFPAFCMMLMMAHVLLIVVGRANPRGFEFDVLRRSVYYSYLVLPWMFLGLYGICHAAGFACLDAALKPAWRLVGAALVLVVAVQNSVAVCRINRNIASQFRYDGPLLSPGSATNSMCRFGCCTPNHVLWYTWVVEGRRSVRKSDMHSALRCFDAAAAREPANIHNAFLRDYALGSMGEPDRQRPPHGQITSNQFQQVFQRIVGETRHPAKWSR